MAVTSNLVVTLLLAAAVGQSANALDSCEAAFDHQVRSSNEVVDDSAILARRIADFNKAAKLNPDGRLNGPDILKLSEILAPYLGGSGVQRASLLEIDFAGNSISFPTAIRSRKLYAIEVVREANARLQIQSLAHASIEFQKTPSNIVVNKNKEQLLAAIRGTPTTVLRGPEILKLAESSARSLGLDADERAALMAKAPAVLQEIVRNLGESEKLSPKSYAIAIIKALEAKRELPILLEFLSKQN